MPLNYNYIDIDNLEHSGFINIEAQYNKYLWTKRLYPTIEIAQHAIYENHYNRDNFHNYPVFSTLEAPILEINVDEYPYNQGRYSFNNINNRAFDFSYNLPSLEGQFKIMWILYADGKMTRKVYSYFGSAVEAIMQKIINNRIKDISTLLLKPIYFGEQVTRDYNINEILKLAED